MTDTPRPVVYATPDPVRTIELPDSNGWYAAVCVLPTGEECLWLLSPATHPDQDRGCDCRICAPHEQAGAWDAGQVVQP